jgi:hypothetical protein
MHPHHGRGRHGIRDEGDSRRHAPSR